MASAVPWVEGGTIPIEFAHHPQQTNVAPVLPNGAVLLGEAGKVAAVSTYRVLELSVGGETVTVQGAPGEVVPLLFAHAADGYTVAARSVAIGADGTAVVSTRV